MPAVPTQGITLSVSIPGSPTSLLSVAQITGFQLNVSAPEIDETDLDSTAYKGRTGVPKYSFTANFNFDPDNARHQAIRDAIRDRTKVEARVTLTDATPATCTFEGFITAWNAGGNVNDKVAGSFSMMVDGIWSWA